MMTLKDWDIERMAQYFDTTKLWKQVNRSTQTERAEVQTQKFFLPETKVKRIRKVERVRRVLPLMRQRSLRR